MQQGETNEILLHMGKHSCKKRSLFETDNWNMLLLSISWVPPPQSSGGSHNFVPTEIHADKKIRQLQLKALLLLNLLKYLFREQRKKKGKEFI
jgi:hypothetical protein